ncbi:MAG: hypothetical protein V9E96_07295 [Chitinophagaceae bacterium]
MAHRDGAMSDAALDRQVGCLARRRDDLAALMAVLVSADRGVAERAVTAAAELPELRACTDTHGAGRARCRRRRQSAGPGGAGASARGLARARADRSAGRFQGGGGGGGGDDWRRPAAAADPALRAAAQLELGLARAKLGAHAEAESSLRAAWLAGLAGHDDAVAARAAIELVTVVGRLLARPDDGLRWAEDARAMLTRRGGERGALGAPGGGARGLVCAGGSVSGGGDGGA